MTKHIDCGWCLFCENSWEGVHACDAELWAKLMPRYDMVEDVSSYAVTASMEEDKWSGEWVSWEDAFREVQKLAAENERLRSALAAQQHRLDAARARNK